MCRRLLAALLLLAAACGGDRPAAAPAAASDTAAVDSAMALVSRAAAITLGAREFPARSDSVLDANGLSIEEYEALLYRIAADSTMSTLYRNAIGGKN
ncbi:MAG: hypothetical protein ACM357_08810 [Gemmatimonadota bacterium]